MPVKTEESRKYEQIYAQLVQMFSSGNCKIGERVPSEREVAARLGVNVRTVRRAFRDLILGGVVEKRVGSGTYLKAFPHIRWEDKPVNVVISNDYDQQGRRMIRCLLPEIAAEKKHLFRMIYADDDELDKIVHSAIALEQSSILCLLNLDRAAAVFERPDLFVVLSSRSFTRGIPCVVCDDRLGIRQLVEHLRESGHRRIALLRPGEAFGDGLVTFQAEAWREAMGEDFDPALELSFEGKRDDGIRSAYECVKAGLARISCSAVICTADELMYGAMAAIREAGFRIPEDMAVASIGNTPLAEFAEPPVTSCDPSIAEHLRAAFDLLDHNHAHPDSPIVSKVIPPELIVRGSTAKSAGRQICNQQ